MKKDEKIKKAVRAELEWGSRLSGSSVNTEIKDGIVILSGYVDSYPKKLNLGKAVETIENVRSVSNFLEVKLPISNYRTDSDIERSVKAAIKWNTDINDSKIICKALNGVVTLEGEVEWDFQRSKAGILAGDITGVIDVKNLITVSFYNTTIHFQKKLNSEFYNQNLRRDYN
jgi:hypothetical protein